VGKRTDHTLPHTDTCQAERQGLGARHASNISSWQSFADLSSRKKQIMEISAATSLSRSYDMSANISEQLQPSLTTDSTTFLPFILIDGHCRALVMFDHHMAFKCHIFAERARDGWTGNGDDWTSIAQVIVAEHLFPITEPVTYDSDANMFSARGCRSSLERLGLELQAIFRNDEAIRDLMTRVTLRL